LHQTKIRSNSHSTNQTGIRSAASPHSEKIGMTTEAEAHIIPTHVTSDPILRPRTDRNYPCPVTFNATLLRRYRSQDAGNHLRPTHNL